MSEIGRKLWINRRQRKTFPSAGGKASYDDCGYGDKSQWISASWLGRIERENHAIAYKRLESLEETIPQIRQRTPIFRHTSCVSQGLTGLGYSLSPPES
jgi:hypothetical protein